MDRSSIEKAVDQAKLFIESATDHLRETERTYTHGDYTFNVSSPKTSGALRRRSMDLTRSLAEMRKP